MTHRLAAVAIEHNRLAAVATDQTTGKEADAWQIAIVLITVQQQQILHWLCQEPSVPEPIRRRAQIIVLAFDRRPNAEIARLVGVHRNHVGLWRKRWNAAFKNLYRLNALNPAMSCENRFSSSLATCHAVDAPLLDALDYRTLMRQSDQALTHSASMHRDFLSRQAGKLTSTACQFTYIELG